MTTLKNLYSFNAGLLKQTSSNATEMKFFEIKHLLTEFMIIPSRVSCLNWRAWAMDRAVTPIFDTL